MTTAADPMLTNVVVYPLADRDRSTGGPADTGEGHLRIRSRR